MTPERIGRYRILRRVGAGGMGVVYEAEDQDGARLALKVLMPHAAEEEEGLLRFKREFRALRRLRHPNVVRVLDAGIDDDVPFIAMEFVVGKDVRRHLRVLPEGPVRERELKRCLREILGALAHVHARRIVHRDLKPENIMVCEDGRVKLMDFGVAQARTEGHDGGLLGTFAYMSPEQIKGLELDGRADLYAVGILVYELMVGSYPFPVEPAAAALHHHANTVPDSILSHVPSADPRLADLAARLLAKDPLERLQTAEMAMSFLGEAPGLTTQSSGPGLLFLPRYAGRDAVHDELIAWARDVERGYGRVASVEGPTGIGKTRVVHELVGALGTNGPLVVRTQCAPERSEAYGVLESVLEALVVHANKQPGVKARRMLGDDAGLLARIFPRLRSKLPPSGWSSPRSPDEQHRLRKAIIGLLGRASLACGLVLVIEDIHWADTETLALLQDCGRTLFAPRPGGRSGETVAPMLLLLTRRALPDGHDAAELLVGRLEARGQLERRTLGPLDLGSVRSMVATMTGEPRPTDECVEDLHRASRGRPILVVETLDAWLQVGLLARRRQGWLYKDAPLGEGGTAGPLPRSRTRRARPLRGDEAALARLDGVDPSSRELLERMALLGRQIPAPLALAVSGLEEGAFLDDIDVAVRERLLVEELHGREVSYRFNHEGLREAVGRQIPVLRRQELHAELGLRLERYYGHARGRVVQVLARHFEAGTRPDRAGRYLMMSAIEAERRGDSEGARTLARRAEGVLGAAAETSAAATTRWIRARCFSADRALAHGAAEAALRWVEGVEAAGTRAPEVWSAALGLRRGRALVALERREDALRALESVEAVMLPPSTALELRALRAELEVGVGDVSAARVELASIVEAADKAAASTQSLTSAAMTAARIDDSTAASLLELALLHARHDEDHRATVALLGRIGARELVLGAWSAARAAFAEARDLARARGWEEDAERWTRQLEALESR